jgi:hypothetical protein
MDASDEDRKKEKIYELNNLLSKIVTNLTILQRNNYRLFGVCQVLLEKLNMHSILMMIVKFQENDSYIELVG